ncbi:hypothetical protein [Corynebacterium sp. HMSC08D02]|nr:hypothetical protein [Corynebacterium sp. HMSC08D02]
MPKPGVGDKPEKGKVRIAIGAITIRTFVALVAKLLADVIRELTGWPTN